MQRQGRAHQRTDHHLALAADVDYPGAKADTDANAHQQQRRRFYQRFSKGILRPKCAFIKGFIGINWIHIKEQQHNRTNYQSS